MAESILLTRNQRSALFAGKPVKLTYPGDKPCPIPIGHVEVLSAHVRLEVTDHRRSAVGDHVLVYTLYNDRVGQRFLAVQDGQIHPEQYAHSGGSRIDPEAGEAVDGFTQKRITAEAKARERLAAGELLAAAEELRAVLKDRIEASPEFMQMAGRDVWLLRSKLDRLVSNVKRRAA